MKNLKRLFTMSMVIILAVMLASPLWAQEAEKININKASVEELTQLKMIGPKCAEQIVAFRDKNGPFEKPEDIVKVKGIGPKTFELNKDRICIE